jgi:hypothetical protein
MDVQWTQGMVAMQFSNEAVSVQNEDSFSCPMHQSKVSNFIFAESLVSFLVKLEHETANVVN